MKKSMKIIGAVLGVLLVAALFVGAGAAAPVVTVTDDALSIGQTTTVTVTLTGTDDPATSDAGTYTLIANDYLTVSAPRVTYDGASAKKPTVTTGAAGYIINAVDIEATKTATITFDAVAVKTAYEADGTATNLKLNLQTGAAAPIQGAFTVMPKIEFVPALTAGKTLVIGDKISVKISGNAKDTFALKKEFGLTPGIESGSKNITLDADGTKTVELTAYGETAAAAVDKVKLYVKDATNAVTGVTTNQVITVKAFTFEADTKATGANGNKNPLKVGDSFPITFRGGAADATFDVEYDEDIFSIPGGVDGKVAITSGQTLTVSVIGVPVDENSTLELVGSDASSYPITIYITPEVYVVKSVGFGDEFTYKVFGAKNDSYDLTYAASTAPNTPITQSTVISKKGEAVSTTLPATIPTDENGYGELTFATGVDTAASTIGGVIIKLGVALDPNTIGNTVTVGPKVTIEAVPANEDGLVYAGDLIKVTINAPDIAGSEENEGIAYAVSDSERLFAGVQEGFVKNFGPAGAGALPLYAFDYNVHLPAATDADAAPGKFSLYMESADDLDGYMAAIKIVTLNAATGADFTEVGTATFPFAGSGVAPLADDASFTAYVPYDSDEFGIDAGETWYLVDNHGYKTATKIVTLADPEDDDYFYFSGLVEEGTYVNASGLEAMIVFPEIIATADIYKGADYIAPLDGSFFAKEGDYEIHVAVVSPADAVIGWQIVDAAGATTLVDEEYGVLVANGDPFVFEGYLSGEYALVPYLDGYLVKGAEAYADGDAFEFTVGKAGDEEITLSAESVIVGQTFKATVYGLPGEEYIVTVTPADAVEIPAQRDVTPLVGANAVSFTMGASGVKEISMKAVKKTDEVTVTLGPSPVDEDATIEITDGTLEVTTGKDAYTIGETIKFIGTSSANNTVYFYIKGQNVKFTQIFKANGKVFTAAGEEWEAKLTYDDLYKSLRFIPDAGTYTFFISTVNDDEESEVTDGTYVTVPVLLKQSFITLTSAPTVVAQGEKIVIEGTANAAKSVVWYIFGNNYLSTGVQKVKDDVFTIKIDGAHTESDVMAAGQYFLVVQHPMYDECYSIAPIDLLRAPAVWNDDEGATAIIYKADLGYAAYENGKLVEIGVPGGEIIFGNNFRQTANAAQALCNAIESENFDDMYAKASFIVGAPTSIIDPIPAKITKGEKLVISGTTTGHKGDIVTVDFRGTAFAPVSKQQSGSASYVTLTTKVQDDGTWAIEYDTTGADCDDYTLSIAVGSLAPATAKITIVDNGGVTPTTQPTAQPTGEQPTTQPTATPATPGFGILAALAGLGAVAVLLLRRQ